LQLAQAGKLTGPVDGLQLIISVLLTFACADLLESRKDLTTCHEIYEALIANLTTEVEELEKAVTAEIEIARGPEIPNAPQSTDDEIQMSDQMARLVQERVNRGKMVEERRGKEIKDIENAISITWVMYMRCTRRSEVCTVSSGVCQVG
jgi:cleavage stimulation factor subunit 3